MGILNLMWLLFIYLLSFLHAAVSEDSTNIDVTAPKLLEIIENLAGDVKTLTRRVNQLSEQNTLLARNLEALQLASKEALFQKWVELTKLEEATWMQHDRPEEEYELMEDPDLFLQMAADAGHPIAQLEIGLLFAYGSETTNRSDTEAVSWYHKAALQNQADAQCYLGIAYHVGRGVEQNYKEALRWYRLAAAQGQATAENNLGWLLLTGATGQDASDIREQQKEAVTWFYKAASHGEPFGKANLGLCFAVGLGGLEVDTTVSLALYQDMESEDIERYTSNIHLAIHSTTCLIDFSFICYTRFSFYECSV